MAEQPRDKSSSRWLTRSLLLLLGAIALVALTLLLVREIPGLQKVLIQVEKTGLKVEVGANDAIDLAGLVDRVAKDEGQKAALLKLLKDRLRVYQVDDPDLVPALASMCPEVPMEDMTTYQTRIGQCDTQGVVKQLRDLAVNRKAPFQKRAVTVRIGTPRSIPMVRGLAYTCFGGELENKRITLVDPATSRQLEVQVRGGYECLPGSQYPDLHIAALDVLDLFGRSTAMVENALALY